MKKKKNKKKFSEISEISEKDLRRKKYFKHKHKKPSKTNEDTS